MKQGKKYILAELLMKFGGLWLVNHINRFLKKKLLILAYHRIYDIKGNESDFPSDIELISASSDQFEWQMNYLRKNYAVMTFQQYHEMPLKSRLKKNIVIVTFDDGFKDNYEIAFSILKKYNLPAVFYISVDYIDSLERFWFEYLVSLVQQIPRDLIPDLCNLIGIDQLIDRSEIADSALDHLKKIPDSERLDIMSRLKQFAVSNQFMSTTDAYAMTWANIIEMREKGMEIGSHTLSHPILVNAGNAQCVREIAESKKIIEDVLKTPCVSISYPNGQADEFNEKIINLVKAADYKYACSYISGFNEHKSLRNYELKRIHVERYTSHSLFAASLALPSIFS